MPKILCMASNKQQIQNLIPITNKLKNDKGCEIVYLNLDSIFHQGTKELLEKERTIDFNFKLKKPYYLLSEFKRLIYYFKIRTNIYFEQKYDAILLGSLGIVEYAICMKIKKNQKINIFLIQDSILLWPEKYNFKKNLRKIFYFFKSRYNICDKIFVSGEATKDTIVADGGKEELLEVSGLPRFEYLRKNNELDLNQESINILFLGKALSWHGKNNLENQIKRILDELETISNENDKFKVYFRKHPRESLKYQYQNITIVEPSSESISTSLSRADIIIDTSFPSTVLFEALHLGSKILYVKSNIDYAKMAGYKKFIEIVNFSKLHNIENNIFKVIKNINSKISDDINYFLLLSDINPSDKICDEIKYCLENRCNKNLSKL